MEVSGEFHSPAALLSGKRPPAPTVQEAVWAPHPVWRRRKYLLPLPGIEFRLLGRPAPILVAVSTQLRGEIKSMDFQEKLVIFHRNT
jgi:hypothetical protein